MDWDGKRRLFLSIYTLVIVIQLSEQQGVSYEAAFRSAIKLTSGISPPATRTVSEIQAFSEHLSPAYSGFEAFPVYTGCQDAYVKGARQPGVFVISRSGLPSFRAWCDFDSSGGWMVIQRRVDGTMDFFKRWTEYEQGFGNLWGEYWLGLNKMHLLTPSAVPLSVYLEGFDGVSAWANYSSFRIGDLVSQYTLSVSGFSGSAGDSLVWHNGYKFTAWDRDNDIDSRNCAEVYTGAWWYRACHTSNLNGRYERGVSTSYATSNCWYTFKGVYYGLKTTIMRILA